MNELTLVSATKIVRHGERTPHVDIPNMPDNWEEGIGLLTKYGIKQHQQLGARFRKLYINKYKILPKIFNHDTVYIRSSGYERTYQTAIAFMQGLYPELSIQNNKAKLKIDRLPITKDKVLLGFEYYRDLSDEGFYTSQHFLDTLMQYQDKILKWSKVLNICLKDIRKIINYGDALYIRKSLGKLIPEGLTDTDINEFNQLSSKFIAMQLSNRKLAALASIDLLKEIQNIVQSDKDCHNSKKFHLYSAHDVTIMALLSALGLPLDTKPPYASHLSILLYKSNQDNNIDKHYIEFIYNDRPLALPGCKTCLSTLVEFTNKIESINTIANEASSCY